ncbi:hypothetical protein DICVIV_01260 [Dictyocaulus viviparus]|uniref:Enhancer of polycomb-like protein n=1 Tax=Dictyocaulus viviparus TaxID=29172 RepID=A0A0D8Y740_DICVI|nr:hypothetical protein DICVIV_01260 [Dictyocaulus viviparus]
MASTSKLSFRARNLDASKAMCVFFAAELPDLSECAPIARAVAQMPTGMEKEEEMESHLQDAILAQQASTSGVRVDNHVIPTPKVLPVDPAWYDEVYPVQPSPPKGSLIKVQAWLALDKEEAEYDVDSEDECWLAERPHIDPRVLEQIFDTLEAKSSDNNICLPGTARSALLAYDEAVVDDVYDYWLAKREKSTTVRSVQLGVGGLIPRVRTECRKDQQGGLNPYVAFRRRAEKMQTRKNRKNDEESYEKVLKLGHDLRKTVTLFDMVKRREKTKIALIDLDSEILAHRMGLLDFGSNIYNQFLAKIRESTKLMGGVTNGIAKSEDDTYLKKRSKRRRIRTVAASVDREVPSKAWLRKNAEVWNRPPSIYTPSGISPVTEVDQSAQAACDANLDGKFLFKRRRGCIYRSPLVSSNEAKDIDVHSKIPTSHRLYETFLPNYNGIIRRVGLTRRRLGRGGRVLFDRFQCWDAPRIPSSSDPFINNLFRDNSVSFRAHLRPWQERTDMSRPFSWSRAAEEEYERRWLASGDGPCSSKCSSQELRLDGNPVPVESIIPDPPTTTQSGNGLAGRVEPSTPIPTKEYGAVAVSDEWREASGSPSESNSSSDWVAPSLAAQIYPVLSVEEEARTGDHPIAKQPPINVKGSLVGATEIEYRSPFFLAPPTVGS